MTLRSNIALLAFFVLTTAGCGSAPNNVNSTNAANANTTMSATPAGSPSAGAGEDQTKGIEDLVADLYKAHDAKKSPFFQTKDRALVDKYFVKALADLIWKDATSSKGEVGAIDGDPLYNAQDLEIKNFAVGRAEVKGDTATLPVTFTNFGNKETITYSLKQTNGAWKIDDIRYGNGDSLMKWLKDTYSGKQDPASSPEFEGKFSVGDTSCTVKAVKMAFEVRWAKGSGAETFFPRDSDSFETDPDKDGGVNRFVFDDDTYNSGTFYRADGKTFPVKRM